MFAERRTELVVCPSCGNFANADEIDEETGFCAECSTEAGFLHCDRCGRSFRSTHVKRCSTCRRIEWHAKWEERFAYHRGRGLTVRQAERIVRDEIRPICLACGDSIRNGRQGVVFCKQYARCRKAKRRHRTLYDPKGRHQLTKDEALEQVLEELENGKI